MIELAALEGSSMSNKPASRLIAKALPRGSQFAAQFALPGLVPDLVRDRAGVCLYDDERAAEIAAKEAVLRLYDSRTRDTRKAGGYQRLTGAELADLIEKMDTTVTYFSELAGFPQSRVMGWIDGEQDIPHSVHVLARLLAASDENFELAERITEQAQR
ncbi:hypothetical protein J2X65_003539 [Ancylobacter sp. 3268]|uniref:hypothetical protein n=1 Tax=Ancylobacter sp. 3268 TaxID=2817752 RepID=UPI00285499CA|nr:hypothetical protein [Ancylobacter sp. 3268]MDR6954171.1 hypothetical protein [Ancylobacter sp. 3268]